MADELELSAASASKRQRRWACWRLLVLLAFLILGALVAGSVFIALHSREQQSRRASLQRGCEQRRSVLQEEFWILGNFSDAFIALRKSSPTFALINTTNTPAVDQTTWERFFESALLGNRFLSHEVWYEHIPNRSRAAMEKAIGVPLRQFCCRREGAPGESLVPRETAAEYAVLTMGAGLDAPFGLDLYSMPSKAQAAILSRDSGLPFYSAPFDGLAGQRVFLSFTPAYSLSVEQEVSATSEQRRAALIGYLGTLFNMSNLVVSVSSRWKEPNFIFRLFDVSPDIMTAQPQAGEGSPLFNKFDDTLGEYHGRYDVMLEADLGGSRKYEVRCTYSLKGGTINEPLLWGGLTFVILVLVGLLLYGAFMHMLIMERTQEFLEVMADDKNVAEEVAKQKKEEATAKMEFIANVGYETQRPIERLAQMTRALMQTPLDGTQLGYVQALRASADVLSSFMGDIHDFARIEEGRLELEKVAFEVRNIVDEVMSVFASKAQAAGLELAALVADKVPSKPLLGDPLRLRQVLMNLVSNAIKFTHEGHVFVRIDVVRNTNEALSTSPSFSTDAVPQGPHHLVSVPSIDAPSPGDQSPSNIRPPKSSFVKGLRDRWTAAPEIVWQQEDETVVLEFEVEDTGVGLSLDAQKNLFQPFSRGTQFLAQRCYGGGMGLSICHRLVQLWNGTLSVSSQMGSGSTFRFTVPLTQAQPSDTVVMQSSYNPFELPALKGQRALVVSEREFPRQVAAAQLRRHGLVVDAVADEKGALDSALAMMGPTGKKEYCCVLVDMEKGADEAHRLASTLRCMPHLRMVPLVLLTSARGPVLEALASLQDYTAVLQKPLRHATIAACMSQVLNVDMPNAALKIHTGEPALAVDDAAIVAPGVTPASMLSLRSLLSGRRLMIVEDNMQSRRLATQLLESLGCQVEYAAAQPQEDAPRAVARGRTSPKHPSMNSAASTLLRRPPPSRPLPSWVTPLNATSPPVTYSPNFDILLSAESATLGSTGLRQDIRTTGHPVRSSRV